MAVNKQQKFAKDFWPYVYRVVATVIITSQLIVLLVIAVILYLFGFYETNLVAFAAILLAEAVLGTVSSVAIYKLVAQPMKDMLAAVIHVSGEPTATTPPNPNDARYEQTGFKDVLQTIYGLASSDSDKHTTILSSATDAPAPITAPVPAVKLAATMLENALNETNCGFVVMNHQRNITFANKAAPLSVDTNGVTSLSLIFNGRETLDAWLEECDKNAVHAEHTWSRIADKLPEEDNRRFFDVIASYDKGAESEVVLSLIDRTHLYEVSEQELDFIAFAAHELRGPITVIRGYLDVLEDELKDVLKDDQIELFHRLTVSANRLSGYINNILNTSRYDRRHLKMHLAETTVNEVYDTIKDDMKLRASAQNRLLAINIPSDLPTIAGDTASLSEVFGNLIDNAIKYSNEGGSIIVSAAQKGDMVEIYVEDHGIGMPTSVIGNLFQKFYRSHRSRETVAGTGIGLYISKAIVESHGGNISVRSEDGRGSTFTVSLPTYTSVADKLKAGDNSNEGLIEHGEGWIKNHSMYRG
ncbi:MAG: HAMP domain-containing histidine kinase [Candidatus Microsaccharimonas sossegonensis]|uniref:histidine kinase n=1 Tax=Candidatus Microsaccharimonas sossegonensis TaxID=2506948 RepID=A0A4Q0AHY8_9BACT|nr:MAG: HAMP domain-containing histidine kinase [Candidatus Microsaccharimonas sossegonensis]